MYMPFISKYGWTQLSKNYFLLTYESVKTMNYYCSDNITEQFGMNLPKLIYFILGYSDTISAKQLMYSMVLSS